MMINSVKLENIRSYVNEKIEFPSGRVLLSGDIGSGKTTILMAVEFALFGLNKGTGNSLLRNGAREGSVELQFTLDEKKIIIKRVLKRVKEDARQTNGYIIINDIKEDCSPVELRSRVINLLGYPSDSLTKKDLIYRYTVYAPQEEMKKILNEDIENRLEILRKIFGIDKYKRIKENVSLSLKDIREKRVRLEGRTEDLSFKKEEKEKKEEERKILVKKQEDVKERLELAKKKTFSKKNKVREAENKLYRYNNMKKDKEHIEKILRDNQERLIVLEKEKEDNEKEIIEIEKKIEEIKFSVQPIKSEEEIKKDIEDKTIKLNQALRNKDLFKEKIVLNEKRADDIKKRIDDFSIEDLKEKQEKFRLLQLEIAQISKLENDLEETRKVILDLVTKIREKQIHMDNSKVLVDKIRKLSNCPTCLQSVEQDHKRKIMSVENKKTLELRSNLDELRNLKEAKEELSEKQRNRHSLLLEKKSLSQRLEFEIQTMHDDYKRITEDRKRLLELKDEKGMFEKQLLAVEGMDTSVLEKTIFNYKKMLDIILDNKMKVKEKQSFLNLIEEKRKHIVKIRRDKQDIKNNDEKKRKDLSDYDSGLDELKNAEQECKLFSEELDKAVASEREIEIESTRGDSEIKNISNIITVFDREIKEKEELVKEGKRLGEIKNWLEGYFVPLMDTMEKNVMTNIYLQFNELFQQWFNQLIEDETINGRLDDQFTPIIEQNGYETNVNFLSGGERTSAALAYRLALNKVINDLVKNINTKELIMLDEPTDGFSSEQLDKVRGVLEDLNFKQTIIVSHEPKIESFVDNVVRINKNEHASEVI